MEISTSDTDPFNALLDELQEKSFPAKKTHNNSKDSFKNLNFEETKVCAQAAIMRYLARREYSKQELQQRLQQKGCPKEIIDELLIELSDDDWQSDLRCAQMLLNHGYKSGWGPNKIRAQMQQKGIKNNVISEVFWQFEDRLFHYKAGLSDKGETGLKTLNIATDQNQIQKLQEIIDNYVPQDVGKAAQLDMLDLDGGDWGDKALAAAWKKFGKSFGHALEKDIKNKAKLQRFLYNKGFESEHINFVLKNYNP